ncbi:MAG: hypothetical protein CL434_05750 [Acidimicrobiaceae bacterium]|jgi:uncharacterized coiled-coil protein SlyX|nr:hypothetical protein [Acidimicrobiaceae bacterium]
MTNNTHDDPLNRASAHLETARRLGRELSTQKRWFAHLRPLPKVIDRVADELAAAIDLVAATVASDRDRTSHLEANHRLLDQSIARLELVTAGDEQLIDDLGAAIEAAQIELIRLERQHDLLRSRLDQPR